MTKPNTTTKNGFSRTSRKKRNGIDSVVLQITTNRVLMRLLDDAVATGFYGCNRAAAAERLIAQSLMGIFHSKRDPETAQALRL